MDALKDFYDFYRPLQRRYDLRMFYKTNGKETKITIRWRGKELVKVAEETTEACFIRARRELEERMKNMSNKLKPKKKHKEPDLTWTKSEKITLKNSNNRRKLVSRSFTDFMDLGYYVLYLHHGFGNKRIVRLERTINEYLDRAQTEKEMKTKTLAELLKMRYGIDVQKEINLIPLQQLIRIYQRNNPLTINDTRQLLNDTAYSYMTLACTALKLMFKLSVREIEEFIAEFRDLIDTLYKFNQFGLTLPKVAQCLADEVNYVDERYIKVID